MANLTAEQQYHTAYSLVLEQVNELKEKMKQHKKRATTNRIDYGHVGDLMHVTQVLSEISEFINQ